MLLVGSRGGAKPDLGPDGSLMDLEVLTYIDEKLDFLLGHFREYFKSRNTSQNLGPQFGIYGSFLPAYQRSPMSPLGVPSQQLRSPFQVARKNTSVPSNQSAREPVPQHVSLNELDFGTLTKDKVTIYSSLALNFSSSEHMDSFDGPQLQGDMFLLTIVEDEKLDFLLGDFREDFEYRNTSENFGPQSGNSGSFLPACQRSPMSPLGVPSRKLRSAFQVARKNASVLSDKIANEPVPQLGSLNEPDFRKLTRDKVAIYNSLAPDFSSSEHGDNSDWTQLQADMVLLTIFQD